MTFPSPFQTLCKQLTLANSGLKQYGIRNWGNVIPGRAEAPEEVVVMPSWQRALRLEREMWPRPIVEGLKCYTKKKGNRESFQIPGGGVA